MRLILDAGALIALARDDRATWRRLKSARRAGQPLVTHAGVVGQVWRGGRPRQALLATALRGVDVRALDEQLGRRSRTLLARTGTSDVIDAALVLLAEDTDHLARYIRPHRSSSAGRGRGPARRPRPGVTVGTPALPRGERLPASRLALRGP